MKRVKQFGKSVLVSGATAVAGIGTASATITADAQTALTAATTDATTVGGYIVAAVGAIAAITIILSLLRKA